jgi:hypothetical protein
LASKHFLDLGDIRIGVIAPRITTSVSSVLDLNPQEVRQRMSAGYDDARDQLEEFLEQSSNCE